jgi:hypothetical protein
MGAHRAVGEHRVCKVAYCSGDGLHGVPPPLSTALVEKRVGKFVAKAFRDRRQAPRSGLVNYLSFQKVHLNQQFGNFL